MLPASTHQGSAVMAFPDVCITPAAPSPIAVPYPSVGSKQTGKTGKSVAKTKTPVAAKDASKADLMKTLDDLHNEIKGMKTLDATKWHIAVDSYVMAVAACYSSGKTIAM